MFKKDYKFFDVAKAISKTSCYHRYPIGCCIVNKNEIISVGCNMKKSHPMQKHFNPLRFNANDSIPSNYHHFLHAEMNALIHASNRNLSGMSIYVYRETRDHHLAMCRPCNACMEALRERGIKKIYYTTQDGFCEENII